MNGEKDHRHCFVLEAAMALPNQYFAGRVGSKFIVSLRDDRKILGVRCPKCEKTFVPPREYCEACWSKLDGNWVELGDAGEVVCFTVVRYWDRHIPKKPPYVLALIKLDGADTPLAHIVENIGPGGLNAGARVKAVFSKETTNTIMDIDHFEPV